MYLGRKVKHSQSATTIHPPIPRPFFYLPSAFCPYILRFHATLLPVLNKSSINHFHPFPNPIQPLTIRWCVSMRFPIIINPFGVLPSHLSLLTSPSSSFHPCHLSSHPSERLPNASIIRDTVTSMHHVPFIRWPVIHVCLYGFRVYAVNWR